MPHHGCQNALRTQHTAISTNVAIVAAAPAALEGGGVTSTVEPRKTQLNESGGEGSEEQGGAEG